MGAGQSSPNDSQAKEITKTSYYALLNVERNATEDELKKAYRRKALELHPDRNYGNEEAATKTFAEIQAAYEVLSDPQERAWYDSHESAILRGGDGGEDGEQPQYQGDIKVTTADDLARMISRFNSRIEFNDGPSGFFGFLRETFEHLAKEEEVAASWEKLEIPGYPSFGHKDDAYDDVAKQFYSVWSSFSSIKTFAWKDKFRLSEAPDRRYRRAMEKENQRARLEGKTEFNEAVRSFVAFVRKRDPRYVPTTQSEAERQKALRDAADAQRKRAQRANADMLKGDAIPDWAKFREQEELEEEEEEEEEQEVFECIACNKLFKSERQMDAHEKSKKHQKALQALKKKMKKDHTNLDLEAESPTTGTATRELINDGERFLSGVDEPRDDHLDQSEDESIETTPNAVQKSVDESEAGGALQHTQPNRAEDNFSGDDAGSLSSSPKDDFTNDRSDSDNDSDYASPETVASRLQSTNIENASAEGNSLHLLDEGSSIADTSKPKMGKAAQKRAKKAAAAAATSESEELSNRCVGCSAAFPSKTRLFQHLKDHPNHAALKPTSGSGKRKKKGKR